MLEHARAQPRPILGSFCAPSPFLKTILRRPLFRRVGWYACRGLFRLGVAREQRARLLPALVGSPSGPARCSLAHLIVSKPPAPIYNTASYHARDGGGGQTVWRPCHSHAAPPRTLPPCCARRTCSPCDAAGRQSRALGCVEARRLPTSQALQHWERRAARVLAGAMLQRRVVHSYSC